MRVYPINISEIVMTKTHYFFSLSDVLQHGKVVDNKILKFSCGYGQITFFIPYDLKIALANRVVNLQQSEWGIGTSPAFSNKCNAKTGTDKTRNGGRFIYLAYEIWRYPSFPQESGCFIVLQTGIY
ncbi:hypothetical protein D3C77_560340 [compost metagenome]